MMHRGADDGGPFSARVSTDLDALVQTPWSAGVLDALTVLLHDNLAALVGTVAPVRPSSACPVPPVCPHPSQSHTPARACIQEDEDADENAVDPDALLEAAGACVRDLADTQLLPLVGRAVDRSVDDVVRAAVARIGGADFDTPQFDACQRSLARVLGPWSAHVEHGARRAGPGPARMAELWTKADAGVGSECSMGRARRGVGRRPPADRARFRPAPVRLLSRLNPGRGGRHG